jgi:hypothetical protein
LNDAREPLKIQSSPKCKARKKFRRATYDLYVSKKFFMQRSSWDEMWIFRGSRKCDCHIPGSCTACCYIGSLQD